jgi:hypothetical protein
MTDEMQGVLAAPADPPHPITHIIPIREIAATNARIHILFLGKEDGPFGIM